MKRNNLLKKISTIALCGCMVIGSLAGCGNEASNSQPTESSVVSSESAASQASTEAEEKPVELTMWSCWNGPATVNGPDETVFYQTIEEACNVDFQFVDNSGGETALSVMIGTNTLPDIVFCGSAELGGGPSSLLDDGLIYDLRELMDKGWMPNLKALLESDSELANLATNDQGQVAWLAQYLATDTPSVTTGYMVRKDWLDELGLEIPTTIEDMEKVQLAFKEKKGAESGLAASYNSTALFASSWNVMEDFYTEGDGVVKYGFMEDAYKEYLTLANKWVELGIFDPDTFTQDKEAFWAKMATGKTGLVKGNLGSEFNKVKVMMQENPGMEWVAIPWPTLEEGQEYTAHVGEYRVKNSYGIFIPKTCSDPEAAARVLDYWVSEEGIMLTHYGIEGVTYEMVDGEPVFTEMITNNPEGKTITDAVALYACMIMNNPGVMTKTARTISYTFKQQQDAMSIWDTPNGTTRVLPPVSMTPEELEEFNMLITDIQTYVNEYKVKFILGNESLDKFDEFRKGLIDLGIERAIELKQAAYDRFLAR